MATDELPFNRKITTGLPTEEGLTGMKKMYRKILPPLFLGFVLLLSVAQTTTVTWSSDPPPTGCTDRDPELIRPWQNVFFWAVDIEDLDTKTTYDSSSCTSTSELVPDGHGGSYWCGHDKGTVVPEPHPLCGHAIYGSGTMFLLDAESWSWPSQGINDPLNSKSSTTAYFVFHDGRADDDPRHDQKILGSSTAHKIIPDYISTEPWGPIYLGESQHGYLFRHKAYNEDHTEFSFENMHLREVITSVVCDNPVEEHVQAIISAATGTWTLTAGNCFDLCDGHAAGSGMMQLFGAGNSTVTLVQVYRITSWGWEDKNPNHAIGMETGFSFNHIQLITFEDISGNYTKVTKNGHTGPPGEPINFDPCGC